MGLKKYSCIAQKTPVGKTQERKHSIIRRCLKLVKTPSHALKKTTAPCSLRALFLGFLDEKPADVSQLIQPRQDCYRYK